MLTASREVAMETDVPFMEISFDEDGDGDDEYKFSEEETVSLRTRSTIPLMTLSDKESLEEAEAVSCGTRSKISLTNTPLAEIEEKLIGPDIQPDLYELYTDDEEWHSFLGTLTKDVPDPSDAMDEEDPDYSAFEEGPEIVDYEDLRTDRSVRISRREVNDLVDELFLASEESAGENSKDAVHPAPNFLSIPCPGLICTDTDLVAMYFSKFKRKIQKRTKQKSKIKFMDQNNHEIKFKRKGHKKRTQIAKQQGSRLTDPMNFKIGGQELDHKLHLGLADTKIEEITDGTEEQLFQVVSQNDLVAHDDRTRGTSIEDQLEVEDFVDDGDLVCCRKKLEVDFDNSQATSMKKQTDTNADRGSLWTGREENQHKSIDGSDQQCMEIWKENVTVNDEGMENMQDNPSSSKTGALWEVCATQPESWPLEHAVINQPHTCQFVTFGEHEMVGELTKSVSPLESGLSRRRSGNESGISMRTPELENGLFRRLSGMKSGLSRRLPELGNGLSRQPSEMESGLSRRPSEMESGLSRRPSEMESGFSMRPPELENDLSRRPSGLESGISMRLPELGNGLSRQPSEMESGLSRRPSEMESGFSMRPPELENDLSRRPSGLECGLSRRPSGLESGFSMRLPELGNSLSRQPSEMESGLSRMPSEMESGLSRRPSVMESGFSMRSPEFESDLSRRPPGLESGLSRRTSGLESGLSKRPSEMESGLSRRPSVMESGLSMRLPKLGNGLSRKPSEMESGLSRKPSEMESCFTMRPPEFESGLSRRPSGLEGGFSMRLPELGNGLSRQSSKMESGLSRRPSEMESGLSRRPSVMESGFSMRSPEFESDSSRRPPGLESGSSRRPSGLESGLSRRPSGLESGLSRRPAELCIANNDGVEKQTSLVSMNCVEVRSNESESRSDEKRKFTASDQLYQQSVGKYAGEVSFKMDIGLAKTHLNKVYLSCGEFNVIANQVSTLVEIRNLPANYCEPSHSNYSFHSVLHNELFTEFRKRHKCRADLYQGSESDSSLGSTFSRMGYKLAEREAECKPQVHIHEDVSIKMIQDIEHPTEDKRTRHRSQRDDTPDHNQIKCEPSEHASLCNHMEHVHETVQRITHVGEMNDTKESTRQIMETFALPETGSDSVVSSLMVSQSQLLNITSNVDLFEELARREALITCVCGLSFISFTYYCLHRSSHDASDPRKCGFCGTRMTTPFDFACHFLKSHKTESDSVVSSLMVSQSQLLNITSNVDLLEELARREALITCVCGLSFISFTYYCLHRSSHDASDPQKCGFCGTRMTTPFDFACHFLKSHKRCSTW